MPSTTLAIGQLRLSPHNVRTRTPAPEDTLALERSILVEGLRVPIDCHPMRGNSKLWGAFAGRRRYFAIKRLVERGELSPDWPVSVVVHDKATDAQLVEMSITENLLRKDMDPHELWSGVAKAAGHGHSAEQIAQALGQPDVRAVARWLRLGQLARSIFQALVDGEISQDQAIAYAGTDDRDLQAAVFARLPRFARPNEIRKALGIGDALARRHLSFVGEAIYRAAGGRYELDLFAEAAEDRGRVVDTGLLEKLVEEKLAGVRDQVRATTTREDLRFVAGPPQTSAHQVDNQLAIAPKQKGDKLELPAGDVVAHIEIDANGEALVSYWWASRKAKFGSDKASEPKPVSAGPIGSVATSAAPARATAGAAIRREEGLSQNATFALSAVRKAILKAALVDGAASRAATDYLVFTQARCLLDAPAPASVGMRRIPVATSDGVTASSMSLADELLRAMPATKVTVAALLRIKSLPFFTDPDLASAFLAYVDADPIDKEVTAALVVGAALERSLAADGYEQPLHEVLAHRVGADRDDEVRRRWFTPSAELLELFPKEQRRTIADSFVDGATYTAWRKLKSADLTTAVLNAVTRAGGKGRSWVPQLLRFKSPFLAHQVLAEQEAAE